LASFDERLDIGVEAGDFGVERCEDADEARFERRHAGGLETIAVGDTLADEVAAKGDEEVKAVALVIARLPAGEAIVAFTAIAGQSTGIDRIAFAEGAQGTDEGLHLAGIGTMNVPPGGDQCIEQDGFVTACRLADHQRVRIKGRGKARQRCAGVGYLRRVPGSAVEDDDLGLADIAADKAGGNGGRMVHPKLSSRGL